MAALVVIGACAVPGEEALAVGEGDRARLGEDQQWGIERDALSIERPRRRWGSITVAACSADCIAWPSLEITRGGRSRRAAANSEAALAQPTRTPRTTSTHRPA